MDTQRQLARPPVLAYRLGSPFAARCAGATGSTAVLAAGYLLFVPFAETTTMQYAAGPCAVEADGRTPAAIVQATTGRSWRTDVATCARLAAASTPPLQLACRSVDKGVP